MSIRITQGNLTIKRRAPKVYGFNSLRKVDESKEFFDSLEKAQVLDFVRKKMNGFKPNRVKIRTRFKIIGNLDPIKAKKIIAKVNRDGFLEYLSQIEGLRTARRDKE